ncbi:MAG: hypothetical protein LQ349_007205 [Xanthoria aureola]|nr:MAG: hypothetical protein LQ349_007205 [Xanthoria aureola]
MALTRSEGTLLMNCKLFLGKARTELSDKAIKSLGDLDQFKDVLLRVARVTPKSLETIFGEVQDRVNADIRRREDEKKIKAFETKQSGAGSLLGVKRRRLTPSTATSSTIACSNQIADKSLTDGDSTLEMETAASVKKVNDDLKLSQEVTTLSTNNPRPQSIALEPSSVSSTQPMNFPRPSHISSDNITHTIQPYSNISFHAPQPANFPSSDGKKQETTLNTPVNSTHPSGIPALPADLQDSTNSDTVDTETVSFVDKYPETAIFTGNKAMFRRLKRHFKEAIYPCFFKQSNEVRSHQQIRQVLELCGTLTFDKVQIDLLAFIILRRQKPGSRAHIIDLGENAEPVEVFQAIKISGVNEADAKLHRVYGQIRLVESIDRKVKSGYVPMSHNNVNDIKQAQLPTFYLDDMAYEMCRGQSPDAKTKLQNKLQREREAGMHWIEMIGSMGGMGIVFVLIFAGVSRDALTTRFNKFQRACLAYIIHKLPSLQRLIGMFNESALEDFCRDGRVSDEIEENVRAAHGPDIAFDTSDGTDSEDEVVSDENDELSDDEGVENHDKIGNDDIVNGESMEEIEAGVNRTPASAIGGRSA